MPQFDDFDEEQVEHRHPQMSMSGSGPTLSAPPSPALSSYSDNLPAGHQGIAGTTGGSALYGLKVKRRNLNSSQSSFPSIKKGKSRSPPSGGEDEAAVSMTSEDEHPSAHMSFNRRTRQHSVDSLASVSTNASTSSKKRSFGAAMGGTGNTAGGITKSPSALSTTRARPAAVDITQIRGINPSAISTPDSSVPGTPVSDYGGQTTSEVMASGCMPPSLLFPHSRSHYGMVDIEDEMGTDEEGEESRSLSGYDFDDSPHEEEENGEDYENLGMGMHMSAASMGLADGGSAMDVGSHEYKRTRTNRKSSRSHDSRIDREAAAMFSPLSLLSGANGNNAVFSSRGTGEGGNIAVPTIGNSTSPSSQATASAATLAAIQAAAAVSGLNTASTPTGRIWVPNNAKPFKCPVIGCDKAYKQQNGLKYHRLHGHCNANGNGPEGEDTSTTSDEDKPFGCYVGPACGKKYKK